MSRISSQQLAGRVPQQRPRPSSVLLLLHIGEPQSTVVRTSARAAAQRREPLLILMMTLDERVSAVCLAGLDTALQLAREEAPGLEVRVQTVGQGSRAAIDNAVQAHPFVVASEDTWWRLSHGVPTARTADSNVLLVGRAGEQIRRAPQGVRSSGGAETLGR